MIGAFLVATAQPATRAEAAPCDPIVPPAPTASVATSAQRLALEPGASSTLTATLELSARPRPVDVFFVLDASRSTQASIDSLRRSIREAATGLAASGIDLRVGAAVFGDFGRNPYVRLSAVRTVDCELDAALAGIETDPVGAVEAHLLALNQALTGSGVPERGVPAGQDAAFRPRAEHFLVHGTDEGIDERYSDGSTYGDVVAEFLAREVSHVGVLVYRDPTSSPNAAFERDEARTDLDRLGRDTGTLAPATGLDCTGDGVPDIAPGQPVTCEFGGPAGAEVGTIVTQVVQRLAPSRTATAAIAAQAEPALTVRTEGGDVTFDPDQPATSRAGVEVTCPAGATGQTYDVAVTGTVDGEAVAAASVAVTCGSAPAPVAAEPDVPAAAAAPGPETAAAPPPPPAPIAPAPAPAPAPAAAQAPASATSTVSQAVPAQTTNLAPVVGIVPEEQTAQGLATNDADRRPLLGADRRLGPSPVVAWGGALLLSAMAVTASWSARPASARTRRPAGRPARSTAARRQGRWPAP